MPKDPKNYEELQEAPQFNIYQAKPIENYGMSLLQAMGFTQNRGIGNYRQNALSQPLVLKPRPKGLGLGAKPQNQEQKKETFPIGQYVKIRKEPHKGMIGVVKDTKQTQNIVKVQLFVSSVEVKVSAENLQKLTPIEYDIKREKVLNQRKEKETQRSKKQKKLKWVLPNIRVKVMDKISPFYLKNVVISQLVSDYQFQCLHISSEGKSYLRNLREKNLQTVIPRQGALVLALKDQYRGKKGKIISRNKNKGEVVVQFIDTLEIVVLHEEEASEFYQL